MTLQKKISVSIESVHITPNVDYTDGGRVDVFAPNDFQSEDVQHIDADYEGVLKTSRDRVEIEYAETVLTGMQGTTSVISFERANPGLVVLSRSGNISSTLCFEAGERIICSQNTEEMSMNLTIYTHELINEMTDDGGDIKIFYQIEFRGSVVEQTVLKIHARILDK